MSSDETRSFMLTVTDDNGIVASDKIEVTLKPLVEFNQPPTVASDTLQIVEASANVNIVMASTDLDNDPLTYQWTQTKGSLVSLVSNNTDTLAFTAPTASSDEILSFQLTVSDGRYTVNRAVRIGVRQRSTAQGTYYYHNDHLGTPQVMTDNAASIVWQASYSAFGQAELLVEEVTSNIRFPGQYFDSETGLHYNYFRDYDPEIGRYIQSDPIGLAGGINTYGYVGGNPVNAIDPRGLDCVSSNNITTCVPVDSSFDPVSFPTPGGWDDFSSDDLNFHDYMFVHDLGNNSGCSGYGNRLNNALLNSPTNDSNAASSNGTLNDVGPLHLFSGVDNVLSYSTNQGILNVTMANHAVGSGFVMRKIVPNGRGGYQIVTYGEGDSWKQLMPGADGLAESFWAANAAVIQQMAQGEGCECGG